MAEIIGRETAIAAGLPPTFDSLQAAILADLPVDTTGIRLDDASGLATGDRIRVDVLTHVLHSWLDGPMIEQAGLPLAGLTGTLSEVNDWFTTEPAAQVRGYLRAKSGTHAEAVALAGYSFAPLRPRRVFAIVVDGLPGPAPHLAVRRQVELFARLVALAPGSG
jgi:D-alanyl-D-alanine carboxypeptidase/D-alanyl-D-alanine-endopeptidase (penicillin-binding protein 4)